MAERRAPTKKTSTTPVSAMVQPNHKMSNAQLAKKWLVSEASISRWAREIDIFDDDAVMAHIRSLPPNNKPKNWKHLTEYNKDEDSLKNRKLELEIARKEFDLAVLMGNYTHNEDLREILLHAGSQLKGGLRKMENSLASELEGKRAPAIQKRMAEEHDKLLTEWSDESSKSYLIRRDPS